MVELLLVSDPRTLEARASRGLFFTYLHCKPDGTPFYVGKGHGKRAMRVVCPRRNRHHQNIVKKYGTKNIQVYVFECDSEQQALADEVQQIAQLRQGGCELANLAAGGEGSSGWKHTEKAKKKIGVASLGNKHAVGNQNSLGRVASPETKKRLSVSHRGKVMSAQSRAKMSIAKRGNKYSLGKTQSAATIEKRAAKVMGNKSNTGRTLPIEQRLKMSTSQRLAWVHRKERLACH